MAISLRRQGGELGIRSEIQLAIVATASAWKRTFPNRKDVPPAAIQSRASTPAIPAAPDEPHRIVEKNLVTANYAEEGRAARPAPQPRPAALARRSRP